MSEKEEKRIEVMQRQMEETMATTRRDLDMLMREMRTRGEATVAKSREAIEERPLTSVGVAFGIGLVIGVVLVKAMEHSRD